MEHIIGIDFGTTNSSVALFDGVEPRIIKDEQGEMLLPSAVYLDDSRQVHVGYAARNVALLYPERTVTSVKRLLGTRASISVGDREYPVEEIASHLFRELKERYWRRTGQAGAKAVVSVPAYYDDPRRRAVEKAANLAGIEVVRLINEPTAAALAYNADGTGTILVYDLGGGTFDVSVLSAGEGVFRVLASRGDPHLGGDDFDAAIVRKLMDEFAEETGLDLRDDRLAQHKLRLAAERAKIALSARSETSIEVPFIGTNLSGACHLNALLTREELNGLVGGFVHRTIRLTKGALSDAGVSVEDVDRVLLVGGSTRMPVVREAVRKLIGREPEADVEPELAVAKGAALQAAIISGETSERLLVDVTPLGLGVETANDGFVTLLPRNTVLPAHSSAVFTTVSDNQRFARVTVMQGEKPNAAENATVGSFDLDGIEQAESGEPDIEVSFDVDVNGILQVRARDLETSSERAVTLQAPSRLSDEEVLEQVEDARETELDSIFSGYEGYAQ